MIPYDEKHLEDLKGAPFIRCHRDERGITFGFGAWVRRDRRRTLTPSFALEVHCAWRLSVDGAFYAGSYDTFRSPTLPAPADFDPNEHHSVADIRMQRFLHDHAGNALRVRSIEVTPQGDLRIELGKDVLLEVFADRAPGEAWRLTAAADAPRFTAPAKASAGHAAKR